MKSVIIICAVIALTQAAVTLTNEQKEKLVNIRIECAQQTGVDPEIKKQLLNGVFPDDAKFRDFLLCAFKKLNLQNEAGEIQKDVILTKISGSVSDPAKAKELVDKCSSQSGSPSETAYNFTKCVYDNTPNRIIIVH